MSVAPMPAPTLRKVQQWMAGLITNPQGFEDPDLHGDAMAGAIAVPAETTVVERLRVYAAGYPARIEESLQEAFPALGHVVGAGAFGALVRRYAGAVPFGSYSLSDVGLRLSDFLRDDTLSAALPFLPDLACLEWQVARAFHAADATPFDPATTAAWDIEDWERAVLRFQAWVAVVPSDWPIREVWECRETPVEEIDVDLRGRPDNVLVRRAGFAVVCESIDGHQAAALMRLMNGEALGRVMADLVACGADPTKISAWFQRWASLRMVAGCSC